MKLFLIFLVVFSLPLVSLFGQKNDYTRYVNPFIGSAGNGHTFPGATVPFGNVQLSPDTGTKGWDHCSGYKSGDSSIIGFSHTHLSGTGCADYGDILLMPIIGPVKFTSGALQNPDAGYRSRFRHATEIASPGYYSVFLDDYRVKVELTATKHVGLHRYTFPPVSNPKILLDLNHGIGDTPIETFVHLVNDHEVEGLRRSTGWAKDQYVYFVLQFSQPFLKRKIVKDDKQVIKAKTAKGRNIKVAFEFGDKASRQILVKVALSAVDINGARKNLQSELPHWNFDRVRQAASHVWNKFLAKIEVQGGTQNQKKIFYTALYHVFIQPNIFTDVDGRYRGMDQKIHRAKGFNYYTVFSLWDTFRAAHPLFNLLLPNINNDFVKTLLAKYDEQGMLPVWELAGNETGTMIGYHSVPVIADALLTGTTDVNPKRALKAMKHSAQAESGGLHYFKTMGFIPMDKENDSVSKTLEYAYDDWCIAQVARLDGAMDDYAYFLSRSKNYLNVFDKKTKFMRGRFYDGRWKPDFNPYDSYPLGSGEYTEANAWQYLWFVPQDINGLFKAMGGDSSAAKMLDEFFTKKTGNLQNLPADVSGLVGQYAQGNEPDHHAAYLYDYVGQAFKTQKLVRKIMNEWYTAKRDGLSGNEDCGQMSAWYVFSALGFYPVTPGSQMYAIGSPVFKKVTLHLLHDKTFTVQADGNAGNRVYIQKAFLNGQPYGKSFLAFKNVVKGGNLRFIMSNRPNPEFAKNSKDRPQTAIVPDVQPIGKNYLFVPYCKTNARLFSDSLNLQLGCMTSGAEIHYTQNGNDPELNAPKYEVPILLTKTSLIKMRSFKNGRRSNLRSEQFYNGYFRKADNSPFPRVRLKFPISPKYLHGGANGLIDGLFGSIKFTDGRWQGIEGKDLVATVDLGKPKTITRLFIRFLENQGVWIFPPTRVEFQVSNDGRNFRTIAVIKNKKLKRENRPKIHIFKTGALNLKNRYIKVIAKNIGHNPLWPHVPGGKLWLFFDELIIRKD